MKVTHKQSRRSPGLYPGRPRVWQAEPPRRFAHCLAQPARACSAAHHWGCGPVAASGAIVRLPVPALARPGLLGDFRIDWDWHWRQGACNVHVTERLLTRTAPGQLLALIMMYQVSHSFEVDISALSLKVSYVKMLKRQRSSETTTTL